MSAVKNWKPRTGYHLVRVCMCCQSKMDSDEYKTPPPCKCGSHDYYCVAPDKGSVGIWKEEAV